MKQLTPIFRDSLMAFLTEISGPALLRPSAADTEEDLR
jgi:hypothetical protein